MARRGEWNLVAEELQPRGKVLSDSEYGARAETAAFATAADLCRRRIGSGEKSHRAKMRCLRHAWRLSGARGGEDRRYERAPRKIRIGAHAIRCGGIRVRAGFGARSGQGDRANYRREAERKGLCELPAVAAGNTVGTEHV